MTASTPTFSATFLSCIGWRTIQGLAVALPLVLLIGRSPDSWPLPAVAMGLAAMLIGAGTGVAADRWLRTKISGPVAIRLAVLPVLSGLWLLYLLPQVEVVVCLSLWIGLGAGSEWSTLADACRGELTPRTRWSGILLWTVMFVVGMSLATLVPATSLGPLVICVAATLAAGVLTTRSFRFIHEPAPATPEQLAAEVAGFAAAQAAANGEPLPDSATIATDADDADDAGCDATDCCGGSKPAAPTRFSQGVLLVATAWSLLFVTLCLVLPETDSLARRLPYLVGLIAGCLLMFTTAPRTGYAVALLPFSLLLPVAVLLHVCLTTGPWLTSVLLLALSVSVAALHTGLRLVAGESFADCASDPVRTRVHVVGLFLAAAVVLIEAALRTLLPVGGWQIIPAMMLVAAAIATLRTLPAPVISSLGEDDATPDPEELNDVMAIVNEQV